MKLSFILTLLFCFAAVSAADAQTASSLFLKSDSLQVKELFAENADMYDLVGHHGPAVENSHMALRMYFNDSGSIDLYSKSARGMELLKYGWYPSEKEKNEYGAGCDVYEVGNTLGFGGVALWDGESVVKLVATRGRKARVGDSSKGSFAEIISYGVVCNDQLYDISVRIDLHAKKREARITVKELNGKKLSFVTGLNFHPGQKVEVGDGFAFVWGIHPGSSIPVGAGIRFATKKFEKVAKESDMVTLVSFPASSVTTTLVGSSTLEAELNSLKRFEAYMRK